MQFTRMPLGPSSAAVAGELHVGRLGDAVGADDRGSLRPLMEEMMMIAPSFPLLHLGLATSVVSVLFEIMLLRILAKASSVIPDIGP